MVRLKLRTCSTGGISMNTSRFASSVTSYSLIIVREFDLMQGISDETLRHSPWSSASRRIQVAKHLSPGPRRPGLPTLRQVFTRFAPPQHHVPDNVHWRTGVRHAIGILAACAGEKVTRVQYKSACFIVEL